MRLTEFNYMGGHRKADHWIIDLILFKQHRKPLKYLITKFNVQLLHLNTGLENVFLYDDNNKKY